MIPTAGTYIVEVDHMDIVPADGIEIPEPPPKPSCAAEDFSAIRRRMQEIRVEQVAAQMAHEISRALDAGMKSSQLRNTPEGQEEEVSQIIRDWMGSAPYRG